MGNVDVLHGCKLIKKFSEHLSMKIIYIFMIWSITIHINRTLSVP